MCCFYSKSLRSTSRLKVCFFTSCKHYATIHINTEIIIGIIMELWNQHQSEIIKSYHHGTSISTSTSTIITFITWYELRTSTSSIVLDPAILPSAIITESYCSKSRSTLPKPVGYFPFVAPLGTRHSNDIYIRVYARLTDHMR